MTSLHHLRTGAAALALPLIALAMGLPVQATAATSLVAPAGAESIFNPSPLISKVRAATARYKDINVATAEGFVQATPCVSGPNSGAMGVHFVLFDRVTNGVLSADQPESLIYEPMPNGAMRFVGVEFIVLVATWESMHPGGGPPALDGHLLNLVSAPNRYGLPAFYEMHVWAWERNPVGSFADWNTHVTCEQQPSN
ncbi:MAG TPA: hypothetical protein VKC11_08140 [Steroidobacteraceae bacterium]|nr:hypothetical protein [Steroidobacteraceae bacterium]